MKLFDLRVIIAFLFGLYGAVLVITGMWFTSADDLEKAADININLWSGAGMLALSAVFTAWAGLRPLRMAGSDTRD